MELIEHRTVLVTGALGFIGRTVCELLRRESYDVVGLDLSGQNQEKVDSGFPVFACDISNPAELEKVFANRTIHAVIHLAAILPTAAQRDPVRATMVNVGGSLNVLEMSRNCGVQRFLFGSSASVYGAYPADECVSETDRTAPEDLYGAAKLYVEQLGKNYRERYGLEFVSLRIARVLGPGTHSSTSAWRSDIFEQLATSHPKLVTLPYAGDERVLLLHVEDVARMLLDLTRVARPKHFVYNAPCESMLISELKHELEQISPELKVVLQNAYATGNPRRMDCSRFTEEFGFTATPIFERLRQASQSS